MKRILVPCDFSTPAREAYKFALELATTSGGEIFVIHIISFPIMYESTFGVQPYPISQAEIAKLEENSTRAFLRLQEEYTSPTGLPITFLPVYDYLLPGIQRITKERKVDLIVMGTQGSSGMEEFFIGSNTEKVVRYSNVPVIALRNATLIASINSIVLPTNLELNETAFISRVQSLQEFFSATLHVLWVNTPVHFKTDKDAKDGIEEFCKHYKLTNYTINVRSSQHESTGIVEFAREIEANMLVMATHKRRGLSHLFAGSITESVVNHVDCPIWTFGLHESKGNLYE